MSNGNTNLLNTSTINDIEAQGYHTCPIKVSTTLASGEVKTYVYARIVHGPRRIKLTAEIKSARATISKCLKKAIQIAGDDLVKLAELEKILNNFKWYIRMVNDGKAHKMNSSKCSELINFF